MRLDEFGLLFPDQSGKGIPKSTLSDILAMSDEILKNPPVDGAHKKKKRAPVYPIFEALYKVGIVSSMDRELVGKYKKYLQHIQVATTISVASMLTLDSATDELQDHVSVLIRVWIKLQICSWNLTKTLYSNNKDPAVVSLSVIIVQKLTSPPADNTTDLPSTDTTTAALSVPPIPTLAEALSPQPLFPKHVCYCSCFSAHSNSTLHSKLG
ncbi:hypothetical protein L211DRAFT_853302 [Terfezia boudieri ATCC MYA-4762]|uniref:Uncharacterized protein n=1 Tax=Terfezia boudieri ATCC MYA-4762 TaxID=1051890 RepID=A0A3N4LC71_9PEZI|nr:hypothetical protein L211DRAFT_853302 [Terfezia boudieri ATCC MYA-4762]